MAKVTITFMDMEDGVSLVVESEPPFPEKDEKAEVGLTDAQQMALSMTMMFDQQMQDAEQEQTKSCSHNNGCEGKHKKEGTCPRHKTTPPDECCNH
jgi:hypothetical protein